MVHRHAFDWDRNTPKKQFQYCPICKCTPITLLGSEAKMGYDAKTVHLGTEGMDIYFYWVDKSDSVYHSVNLNIDQVVLLMKQAAEIISQCSIVRPIP